MTRKGDSHKGEIDASSIVLLRVAPYTPLDIQGIGERQLLAEEQTTANEHTSTEDCLDRLAKIGQEPSFKLVCTKVLFRVFGKCETQVVNLRFVKREIRFRANKIAALDMGG